ncbi:MAG TPA: PaaI family thioesterase [Aquabacterium sp.]|mgnify:CR=1 FL=1|nr:PaaI family thioesterase [Aquabacterium sp.]HQC96918.1 PaaI family thioesterase [Aquabacterium sp.]
MATTDEITRFMRQAFPGSSFEIVTSGDRHATIRRPVTEADTRPGGTVSGPTLMALADTALYVAVHATLGITPHAVTSQLNIHFLRRPAGGKPVVAVCRLLRVGRSMAVGEVALYSEGEDEPVAHATGSYALPAKRGGEPASTPVSG